jgi:hypothetical protein
MIRYSVQIYAQNRIFIATGEAEIYILIASPQH